jgi:hypothetical protein
MTFKKNIFFTKKKITPEKGGLQKKRKKKSAVIIFVALNDIYPLPSLIIRLWEMWKSTAVKIIVSRSRYTQRT